MQDVRDGLINCIIVKDFPGLEEIILRQEIL